MKLYVFGNSHIRALRGGMRTVGKRNWEEIVVFPLGTADNETASFSTRVDDRVVPTNTRFVNKLAKNFGFDAFTPGPLWGVCFGTHNYRLFGHEGWLQAAPSWLEMPGYQPVPRAVFDDMVAEDQRHIRAFFEQLLEVGIRPLVISAPWPVRHNPIIAEIGVRPNIVQAIDQRARALFQDWLAARNLTFIPPPPDTADEDGFLKPAFAKGGHDPCHANFAYGSLMMEQILDAADSLTSSSI